jgi:predicted MFS family arabinose efflux permease
MHQLVWKLSISITRPCSSSHCSSTLAFSGNPFHIAVAFICYQALAPLIIFGLDIFFEGALVSIRDAEKVRSYYLTFMNLAFVMAPLAVGALVNRGAFSTVYILAATCVGLLWFLIFDLFSGLQPHRFREIGFIDSIQKFVRRKNLSGIFFIDFLLQCFYALMVIFTGPYLHTVIGLSWSSIGIIFTIMLLPFVIFEAPLGKMFERLHDERDILIAGFLIMVVSTVTMGLSHSTSIIFWATVLFMSRVGASFVEVAAEASFFRRVTDEDAGFISIFRLAVPLSYVVAPFAANYIVQVLPLQSLYLVLGGVLVLGIGTAYKLSM